MKFVDGIIVLNKEKGITSRDLVNRVCREFKTKKVGHTGTLDPLASGVMVICVGKALKLVELLTNHDKEYIAEAYVGMLTDTLDITGNVLKEDSKEVNLDKIEDILKSFKGTYMQEVPAYSSIKVKGKKLYDYARNGIEVALPKREVEIKEIELLSVNDNRFSFRVVVSKGTYIRSLIRDIGYKLESYAVMSNLVRTRLGDYKLDDCSVISEDKLIKIENVLKINKIKVNGDLEFKIKNGCRVDKFFDDKYAYIMDSGDNLIAIYENIDNQACPYRVFN